jgi:hypothetical protein
MSFCENFVFGLIALILIASTAIYMIGSVVLDIRELINKDDLYEELTQTDYYYDIKVELGLIVAIISLLIISVFFIFIRSCKPYVTFIVVFPVPFFFLGITAAIYSIFILVDMNNSHCEANLNRIDRYVSNLDWGSHDGRKLQRHLYNVSDIYDIRENALKWVKDICDKEYNTRALIVGLGGIGLCVFITSLCSMPLFLYFVIYELFIC